MTTSENARYRLMYAEARSACQQLGNDPDKIARRIENMEMRIAAMKEVLEKKDFR